MGGTNQNSRIASIHFNGRKPEFSKVSRNHEINESIANIFAFSIKWNYVHSMRVNLFLFIFSSVIIHVLSFVSETPRGDSGWWKRD